jgi:DNA replication ATP-dependent helicase Dna2
MMSAENIADSISEVVDAIDEELQVASRFFRFRVSDLSQQANIWKVFVEPMNASSSLDESLEGAAAWWSGPPAGTADVLSVIADTDQLNIRYLSSPPPQKGQEIRIYPPRYLEALRDCWETSSWAAQCFGWLTRVTGAQLADLEDVDRIENFPKLRTAQRQAFGLLERDHGFLWGPPGTGKTYTLGAMLSRYLCQRPTAKVLLLSTTNVAVDLALISVDEHLQRLSASNRVAASLRKKCLRIGNHFVASKYKGREHLLPTPDESLISRLADLETKMPDPADVVAYAAWKDRVKSLRAQIPRPIDQAQLAAMTTTGAAFSFEALYVRKPFDLVVFDEASQASLAHALALAPLGRQVIFAGDDKQLAPVVQSEHPLARKWLGRSMFVHKNERGTCLLNEQGRMEESICDVVGNVFYDGKLIVAEDCEGNPIWRAERVVRDVVPMGRKNVYLHLCQQEGVFNSNYGGPVRFESADFIAELVARLVRTLSPEQIAVLCPYRAQRSVLKSNLRRKGFSAVKVSTVHRAQGSECHTVIFDSVLASTEFLNNDENGPRLLNVALSRAQARLVIVASRGDLQNRWLQRIANVISSRDGAGDDAVPMEEIIFQNDFPAMQADIVVRYRDIVGKIQPAPTTDSFCIMDFRTGQTRTFRIDLVRKQCKSEQR